MEDVASSVDFVTGRSILTRRESKRPPKRTRPSPQPAARASSGSRNAAEGAAASSANDNEVEQGECSVDSFFPHDVADSAHGKFYLFTMVRTNMPGRKTPDEVGRRGLYEALVATYRAVFPADHECHNGPKHGLVARELHKHSPLQSRRQPHLHAAAELPKEHRWKMIERELRVRHRIKVSSFRNPKICGIRWFSGILLLC